ncbi:MAG: hypothetical protein E7331_03450 [Clostridiales bacterium]|nr:hypothetical protein [Clostridiales bacterium]
MKKRTHSILYSLLGLGVMVTLFFALYHASEAVRAKDALEINYTQRLMESRENLSAISLGLGKLPAAGENHTIIQLLSGAGVRAEGLVGDLSSLPLSHAAMEDAIIFCNQLSEYTGLLLDKLASGRSLTEKERETLAGLCSQCRLLEGQFALAWDTMLQDSLRLSPQDNVFYQEPSAASRPLEIAGAAGMAYPSMVYDGAFSHARSTGVPKALGSKAVTAEEAIRIATEYIGAPRVTSAVHGADISGDLSCYGVTLTLGDGTVLNAAVTRQGGQLLWIMPEHASFSAALTLEECRRSAEYFLLNHEYGPMEIVDYQVYDGMAVLNFVSVQDGALLYPDLVKVQLRMDTGEVVGLEAHDYIMNHTRRQKLEAALSPEAALEKVQGRLENAEVRLCLIPWQQQERLCYELKGSLDGQEYRIYIDANTGEEVEVHMTVDGTDGPLSV